MFSALANTFNIIENTPGRNDSIEILGNYFKTVLNTEHLIPSIYLSLNTLGPEYYIETKELGISDITLLKAISEYSGKNIKILKEEKENFGDTGLVVKNNICNKLKTSSSLKVKEIFEKLVILSNISGTSAVNKKINNIVDILKSCDQIEGLYLARFITGKLRIGIAISTILKSLALAFFPDKKIDLSEAYNICPNFDILFENIKVNNLKPSIIPGIPVKPMLSTPSKNVDEAKSIGDEFFCEWKYDGERVQIHVDDLANISIFSRNIENTTLKYLDLVQQIKNSLKDKVTNCVLDGEIVAWDPVDKKLLSFQTLSSRKKVVKNINDVEIPVCVFLFDIIYLNGNMLLNYPLYKRRQFLKNIINITTGKIDIVNYKILSCNEEIKELMNEAVENSCEGLIVKSTNSPYEIGKKTKYWFKLKKDYLETVGDTQDLIVIGAFRGKGKRSGLLGSFLLASITEDRSQIQCICKIGTGFSEELLKNFTKKLNKIIIDEPPNNYVYKAKPDIWVKPVYIWEVKCADITLSPSYLAGIGIIDNKKGVSLRFPRFVRERPDKNLDSVTTSETIVHQLNK